MKNSQMNRRKSARFFPYLPLVFVAIGYVGVFIAARAGQEVFSAVHGWLELVIGGALVGSFYVVKRLLPQRHEPYTRLPLVLNGLVVMTTAGAIIFAIAMIYG